MEKDLPIKSLHKCSSCGRTPKKTKVTWTCWISEQDDYLYECPNKKCEWNISQFIWNSNLYDEWAANHKQPRLYYVNATKQMEALTGWSRNRVRHWNSFHMSNQPEPAKVEPKTEEVNPIDMLEL